ncbi:MAG: beta-ribofuranosylaminobenzene 5'-phosphate synthase family protein [Thermoprotei archaeon]
MDAVEVITSARLHMGFYNFRDGDRAYGSIGAAIKEPRVRVIVSKAPQLEIVNETSIPVSDVVELVSKRLGIRGFKLIVKEAIPRHVGLGSTTQLALAIAQGINKVYGLGFSTRELALLLGRGLVSGIGIAAFELGGFIIDSGRVIKNEKLELPHTTSDLPYPVYRAKLPNNWYFVVIVPRTSKRVSEKEEEPITAVPRELDRESKLRLYRILLYKLLPSIATKDIRGFGQAIYEIQRITGEYFSSYQEGIWCCRETEAIVDAMLRYGAYGVGQSSWGPVAYGIVDSSVKARELYHRVLRDLEREGVEIEHAYITNTRNRGYLTRFLSENSP